MARSTSILVLLSIVSIALSGCLLSNDDGGDFVLVVNSDANFATIVETYSEGELTETTPAMGKMATS